MTYITQLSYWSLLYKLKKKLIMFGYTCQPFRRTVIFPQKYLLLKHLYGYNRKTVYSIYVLGYTIGKRGDYHDSKADVYLEDYALCRYAVCQNTIQRPSLRQIYDFENDSGGTPGVRRPGRKDTGL